MSKEENESSENCNQLEGRQIIVITPEQLKSLPNNQPIYILVPTQDAKQNCKPEKPKEHLQSQSVEVPQQINSSDNQSVQNISTSDVSHSIPATLGTSVHQSIPSHIHQSPNVLNIMSSSQQPMISTSCFTIDSNQQTLSLSQRSVFPPHSSVISTSSVPFPPTVSQIYNVPFQTFQSSQGAQLTLQSVQSSSEVLSSQHMASCMRSQQHEPLHPKENAISFAHPPVTTQEHVHSLQLKNPCSNSQKNTDFLANNTCSYMNIPSPLFSNSEFVHPSPQVSAHLDSDTNKKRTNANLSGFTSPSSPPPPEMYTPLVNMPSHKSFETQTPSGACPTPIANVSPLLPTNCPSPSMKITTPLSHACPTLITKVPPFLPSIHPTTNITPALTSNCSTPIKNVPAALSNHCNLSSTYSYVPSIPKQPPLQVNSTIPIGIDPSSLSDKPVNMYPELVQPPLPGNSPIHSPTIPPPPPSALTQIQDMTRSSFALVSNFPTTNTDRSPSSAPFESQEIAQITNMIDPVSQSQPITRSSNVVTIPPNLSLSSSHITKNESTSITTDEQTTIQSVIQSKMDIQPSATSIDAYSLQTSISPGKGTVAIKNVISQFPNNQIPSADFIIPLPSKSTESQAHIQNSTNFNRNIPQLSCQNNLAQPVFNSHMNSNLLAITSTEDTISTLHPSLTKISYKNDSAPPSVFSICPPPFTTTSNSHSVPSINTSFQSPCYPTMQHADFYIPPPQFNTSSTQFLPPFRNVPPQQFSNYSPQTPTSVRNITPFLQPPLLSQIDMSVPPPIFEPNSSSSIPFATLIPPQFPPANTCISSSFASTISPNLGSRFFPPGIVSNISMNTGASPSKRTKRINRWDVVEENPVISKPALLASPAKSSEPISERRDSNRSSSPKRFRSSRCEKSSTVSSKSRRDNQRGHCSYRNTHFSRYSSQRTNRSNDINRNASTSSKTKDSNLPKDIEFTTLVSSPAPDFFILDSKTGNNKSTVLLQKLEDRFDEEVLHRKSRVLEGVTPWTPLDRTKLEVTLTAELGDSMAASIEDQNSSFSSDMSISSSSSDENSSNFSKRRQRKPTKKKKKPADEKKKKVITLKELMNDDEPDAPLMTIRNNTIRTARQRHEIEYKMAHPHKLHPDLWFNERGEYNDGPSCSCLTKYRIGPLHNIYEGETIVTSCDPESNNKHRLYHYRIHIDPVKNFKLKNPTIIQHNNKNYVFDGYSMFTHYRIESCPPCEILRFNHYYNMRFSNEDFPENFTVRSIDQIADFIFTELLELVDIEPRADSAKGQGCRLFHLMPRFVHTPTHPQREAVGEILSSSALLDYLLRSAQPVIDPMELSHINRMSSKEWSEYIQDLRGTIVTVPGKKPAAIRIDQLDRKSADQDTPESVLIYPYIVHITYTPIKLSLARDPKYKKVWKNFMRFQYLMMNKSRITDKDRTCLNRLTEKLESMETNSKRRREITIEISCEGFYRTGFKTDVTQMALVVPSFIVHIRFHKSLDSLEERLEHKFQNKAILHQALTHPSYQRTNFGSNPDHVQNSTMSCGFRYIDYGDRLQLYKGWRRKGLTPMIQIMSRMPNYEEKQSPIYGNERLEFLGDAVIEIISSVHLFLLFPNMSEGHLDAYRQALVQNHHLSQLAVRLGIHRHLLYTHSTDFCLDTTFMHARSDAFEAVMAAVALDGGLNVADRIFGSVLFGDDPSVTKVWFSVPAHPLQQQAPDGDRDWIDRTPLLKNLTKLEDNLGFEFKHIRLLARSLTVRKTGFNLFTLGDNQRMEFLGDSLLKYVSTDYLFRHFPRHHEGHLSLLKNSLVNKYTQADICTELGLEDFVIQRQDSGPAVKERTQDQKIKYKADILEAFLGALFVDKDLVWVERFCQVCFWPRLIEFILKQEWNDSKSKLQQCCLTLRGLDEEEPEIAQYKVLDYRGPTNRRMYSVGVYFRGERLATGAGRTVKMAEMEAAEQALKIHYDAFPQLRFQQSVIRHRYNEKYISTMLNLISSSDQRLVDKFVHGGDTLEDILAPKTPEKPSVPMSGTLADIRGPRAKSNTQAPSTSSTHSSRRESSSSRRESSSSRRESSSSRWESSSSRRESSSVSLSTKRSTADSVSLLAANTERKTSHSSQEKEDRSLHRSASASSFVHSRHLPDLSRSSGNNSSQVASSSRKRRALSPENTSYFPQTSSKKDQYSKDLKTTQTQSTISDNRAVDTKSDFNSVSSLPLSGSRFDPNSKIVCSTSLKTNMDANPPQIRSDPRWKPSLSTKVSSTAPCPPSDPRTSLLNSPSNYTAQKIASIIPSREQYSASGSNLDRSNFPPNTKKVCLVSSVNSVDTNNPQIRSDPRMKPSLSSKFSVTDSLRPSDPRTKYPPLLSADSNNSSAQKTASIGPSDPRKRHSTFQRSSANLSAPTFCSDPRLKPSSSKGLFDSGGEPPMAVATVSSVSSVPRIRSSSNSKSVAPVLVVPTDPQLLFRSSSNPVSGPARSTSPISSFLESLMKSCKPPIKDDGPQK